MELYKGTSINPEELSKLKCKQRWNAVRKSYADMRGLNYAPLPDYSNIILPPRPPPKQQTQKALRFKNKYNKTKRMN